MMSLYVFSFTTLQHTDETIMQYYCI